MRGLDPRIHPQAVEWRLDGRIKPTAVRFKSSQQAACYCDSEYFCQLPLHLTPTAASEREPCGSDFAIHPMADIFGEADALLLRIEDRLRRRAEGASLTKAIRSPMLAAKR